MKKILKLVSIIVIIATASIANAENYKIDSDKAHASINFRIKHLGYSWLYGRFNTFSGSFNIDRDNLEKSNVTVTIDPASVDTNYAERDKHLRSSDFLSVEEFPQATFKSTSLKLNDDKKSGVLTGDLTLHGVTKAIDIAVKLTGEGADKWGGYRAGFEGNTALTLKDFGIKDFAPAATEVEMILSIEGIRQ